IATQGLARGHAVTCVARGESGAVADDTTLVATDRSRPDAYDAVPARDWDAVFEVSWQPGFVKGALAAFGARANPWTSGPLATAVVDVRDLASWLLDNAEAGRTGTFDTYGPVVPFGEWIETAREVGGHTGPVVLAPREWLEEQKVEQYMGPDSLAMWLTEPG